MKKEISIKKCFEEKISKDFSKLSRKELLKILEETDKLYSCELIELVAQVWDREYKAILAEYVEEVKEETQWVMGCIKEFIECKDKEQKDKLFKAIVEKFDEKLLIDKYCTIEKGMFPLIDYSFELEDVHSAVILMKRRKEMVDYHRGYDTKEMSGHIDGLDARQRYQKFTKMVAYGCDDETAKIYMQELIDGKYMKLYHSTERGGWVIYPEELMESFKFYRQQREESSEM